MGIIGTASIGVIAAVVSGWTNIRTTRQRLEARHNELWLQLNQQQEEQITDRFNRAIEQFGSDKLWISIGRIYALERIALDSEKDHWAVVETLTAYVRDYVRKADQWFTLPDAWLVPPDIQAILTVLGRRNRSHEREDQRLDLSKADLRGANLKGAHLERAILVQAQLEKAVLFGAKLQEANLTDAHLEGADLRDSHRSRAMLPGAQLQGAFINSVDLADTVGLVPEQLRNTYGTSSARLPDYLNQST